VLEALQARSRKLALIRAGLLLVSRTAPRLLCLSSLGKMSVAESAALTQADDWIKL
jgi:hypothetical protein